MEISFQATHRQIQNGAKRPIASRNMAALLLLTPTFSIHKRRGK